MIKKLIAEALRIEEDVTHSGKAQFNAGNRWRNYHYWLGIPATLMGVAAGVSALNEFPILAGVIAFGAAAFAGLMTFLNADQKATAYKATGAAYFELKNRARIFREIECADQSNLDALKQKLYELDQRRNELNAQALEVSRKDFEEARKGIDAGEQEYRADREEG